MNPIKIQVNNKERFANAEEFISIPNLDDSDHRLYSNTVFPIYSKC